MHALSLKGQKRKQSIKIKLKKKFAHLTCANGFYNKIQMNSTPHLMIFIKSKVQSRPPCPSGATPRDAPRWAAPARTEGWCRLGSGNKEPVCSASPQICSSVAGRSDIWGRVRPAGMPWSHFLPTRSAGSVRRRKVTPGPGARPARRIHQSRRRRGGRGSSSASSGTSENTGRRETLWGSPN